MSCGMRVLGGLCGDETVAAADGRDLEAQVGEPRVATLVDNLEVCLMAGDDADLLQRLVRFAEMVFRVLCEPMIALVWAGRWV